MPFAPSTTNLIQTRSQRKIVAFKGFPLGINRSVGAKQLSMDELVEGLNIKYTDDGRIVTRSGLERVTSFATDGGAAITYISNGLVDQEGVFFDQHLFDSITFGGGSGFRHCVIVADANYKIYYLEGDNLNEIGTAKGEVRIAPFSGYVVIFDGSYIKYWDGTFFKMAYDYGSGTSAYQFDDTDLDNDTYDSLYSGAHTRFGGSFTTQAWDTGFTIPILNARVMLSKTGSPTGNMVVKLYDSTRANVLATSPNFDVSTLTTTATVTDIAFDPDNTYSMAPDTTYFLSVEYSGGSASAYVKVHVDTVASAGAAAYYSGSSWTTVSTQTPLIAVQPGRPPKASYGCAWQNRLWFLDPENPGWARFTNANTLFDYSTAEAAGYVGSVDDNAKNYPIGTILPHYGNLYLVGRKEAPYISKIVGTEPLDFQQYVLLQSISGYPLTVVSTINDVWITNDTGVYSIAGVQEYGDIRSNEPGNPVLPTITTYFDDDAFSAFNPIDGQYWLKLTGYSRVLVAHTHNPVNAGGGYRYRWTEYLFAGITPASFGFSIDTFYVGGTDGHLYSLTADVNDNGTQPTYQVKGCVVENPFRTAQVEEYYASINSDASATMSLKLYRNGGGTALVTKNITALSDMLTGRLNFKCRSFQMELSGFTITKPVNIGEIYFKTRAMGV